MKAPKSTPEAAEAFLRHGIPESCGMPYSASSGQSSRAISSTTMFDVFGMTLVAILKGNTASMATAAGYADR